MFMSIHAMGLAALYSLTNVYLACLQPVVYMGIHVVLCWVATLTAMFWWRSKTAHTVFLIFCASVSAWNGELLGCLSSC